MSINIYEFDIGYSVKGDENVTFFEQYYEIKNKMFKKKQKQDDSGYVVIENVYDLLYEKTDKRRKTYKGEKYEPIIEIKITLDLYNKILKNNDVLTENRNLQDVNKNFKFYKNKYKNNLQKGKPKSANNKYMRDILNNEIKLRSSGTDTESYIYRWDVNNDKVFIFGDLHGSFHTFFRSMMRLHYCGIINENFEIKEGYRILFCGDIVDRGQYSLEILSFIFQLIKNNEDKVYMIRGNHETTEIYGRKTFHNEPKNLTDEFKTKKLNKKQQSNIRNFINNSPVAIILVCNGKKIWCCHGSIPYDLDNKILCNIKDLIEFIKNENNEENKIFKCNNNLTRYIMWTDLIYGNIETYTRRGIIGLKDINYEKLEKLFLLLGIDFMIRGHQDNDFNTTLFHNFWIENYYEINGKDKVTVDYTIKNLKPTFGIPLLRFMQENTNIKSDIVKTTLALTITTNMDVDRYLPRDSFIMVGPTDMNEDTLVVPENEELKLKAVYNLKIEKEEKKGGSIIKFNNKRSKILKKYKNKKNNKKTKRINTKNIFNKTSKIKFSNRKIKTKKL